ncbi:MAG: hypothetical protein KIT84_08430 [Labilithrix sp.]|nr:hypothetical protein [Labilithrix sp.]MCW5811024.1 hypothetical protein [Labilithrix sp.]
MRRLVVLALVSLALVACGPSKPEGSLDGVVALSGGDDLACAHRSDGSTWCWGDTSLTGSGSSSYARPAVLPGIERASSMGAQVCVILQDRSVACSEASFGRFNSAWAPVPAQLLPESAARSERPVRLGRVSGLEDVVQVGTGTYIDCVRRRDATVACWGDAAEVLRTGTHDRTRPAGARVANGHLVTDVKGLPPIVHLSVGVGSALAIGEDGSAWVLGGVARGVLRVAGVDDAVEAASGHAFHCVRRRGGEVACWRDGVAAESLSKVQTSPQRIDLPPAAKIAAGPWGACALLAGGGTACWGGDRGVAKAETSSWLSPKRISNADALEDLVVGAFFACGNDAAGNVLCWGDARRLGVGYEGPRQRAKAPHAMGWVQLSAGAEALAQADRKAWLTGAVALAGIFVGLLSARRLVARATDVWRRLPAAPLLAGAGYRAGEIAMTRSSAPPLVRAAIALGLASAGADAAVIVVFDSLYAATTKGTFVFGALAAAAWIAFAVAAVARATRGGHAPLRRWRLVGGLALFVHAAMGLFALIAKYELVWTLAGERAAAPGAAGLVTGVLQLTSALGLVAGGAMIAASRHHRALSEFHAQDR